MGRVTDKAVQAVFAQFCASAKRCGFPDADKWRLLDAGYYSLAVLATDGSCVQYYDHSIAGVIGSTRREAYNWLYASLKTMNAVAQLRDKEDVSHV